jgi:hypothetical protein
MAAARNQVSIVRITLALLSLALITVVVGSTFIAGMSAGIRRQQAKEWSRELRSAQWTTLLTGFGELADVERFGILARREGNAVDLYWPDGVHNVASPCGSVRGGSFDSPEWQRTDDWRHATRCVRIEQLVQAASMTRMDLSDWLASREPGAVPGSNTWFGVHYSPYGDMKATLARAHQRIEDGDLDGAEEDARAVVSAGLHFLRGAPDLGGMVMPSITAGFALDHLREIAERRGDAALASEIVAAGSKLGELNRGVWRLSDSAMKAAFFDEQMHYVSRMALDPSVPLGLRLNAAIMVGYGGLFHPSEVAFGPGEARQRAIDELAADPVLAVAIARGLEPYSKNLRERFDLYASTLGMD